MESTSPAWSVFDPEIPVLIHTYPFGPGRVNALAVGCEGGLIVLSPPYRAHRDTFDALQRHGPVRGLVATNAFHHVGIPEWKRRFPDATVFAPVQSIARVQRKSGLSGIRPVSDANTLAGARVELTDMPYYRTGEVLGRIRSSRGLAWYLTDIVININDPPVNPLLRLMIKVIYGPGLHYNRIAPLFMVRDKAALKRWLAEEYRKDDPRWLIVAHGDVVDLTATPHSGPSLFEASKRA
jgi:hypothetical protein